MTALFVVHADVAGETAFVRDQLVPALELPDGEVQLSSALPLGASRLGAIEAAVTAAKVTVVVLSPAFLASSWATIGELLAGHVAVAGGQLIPLVLVDCEVPTRLDMRVGLDCRDPAQRLGELAKLRRLVNPAGPADAPPGKRIFLSYRRAGEEAALALRLHTALTAAGHDVFIDVGMTIGTEWVREIRQRIAWSDAFVVLVSEDTVGREMVLEEVRAAARCLRRTRQPMILPVRVRYEGPLGYELDSYLGKYQYATWEREADDAALVAQLARALRKGPVPASEVSNVLPAAGAPDAAAPATRPAPAQDPRVVALGGAIGARDPVYVRRACDDLIDQAVEAGRTTLIKAPRQRGKTSLLVRYIDRCMARGKQVTFVDFQTLEGADLETYPGFLSSLAGAIADGFELGPAPAITRQAQLEKWLQDTVLTPERGPVVLAFDEVDRINSRPYRGDFFSMLRSWHNRMVSPTAKRWAGLALALVLSTEPEALIDDPNQSPFNVSVPIEVPLFTRAQCHELNTRLGAPLAADLVDDVHELVGGHPYLTRLAFFELQTGRLTAPIDRGIAADAQGSFGDHLRTILTRLSRHPALLAGLKQVITPKKGVKIDAAIGHRLTSLGVAHTVRGALVPSNLLYALFFEKV